MNTQEKNHGAAAMFSALNWLQERVPGCEISFDIPVEQQLNVERNGIRYAVEQRGDGFALGMDTPEGYERTTDPNDFYEDYVEVVFRLGKEIMADPRQDDLDPWEDRPKDMTFVLTKPE